MDSNSNIHRPDNVPLGVATIVGTVLALSLGDALIKSLGGGGGTGLWQLFAVRSLLAFPVLLGAALTFLNRNRLMPNSVRWIAVRSLLLTAMWIAYYLALPLLRVIVKSGVQAILMRRLDPGLMA